MRDVLARYGFALDRRGEMCCPFHREKTPSFGVYAEGKRWKCFGCGAGGDIFSFVMKLFGLSFSQAVLRLSADFGIGARGEDAGREAWERLRRQKWAERQELAAYRREWERHLARLHGYEEALRWCRPLVPMEPMLPVYVEAASNLDNEWDWLCGHPWR